MVKFIVLSNYVRVVWCFWTIMLLSATTERLRAQSMSDCFDSSKLDYICASIAAVADDEVPNSEFLYKAQRQIYEAACVDYINDDEEQIGKKVSAMWKRYDHLLYCDLTGTNKPILWALVRNKMTQLVKEAALLWKIDLNVVDNEGNTVLDFVYSELDRNKGSALEPIWEDYRKVLEKAGAKRAKDL